jgi:hypothetical protein
MRIKPGLVVIFFKVFEKFQCGSLQHAEYFGHSIYKNKKGIDCSIPLHSQ